MPGTFRSSFAFAIALTLLLAEGRPAVAASDTLIPMVYVHELGHNLGMGHGATDPENDGIPNVGYGDASEGGPEGPQDVVASGTSYTDRDTTSGASYAYTVHALDAVGNESGVSNVVSLTLGGKSGGPQGGGGGGSGGGKGKGKNK